MDQKKTEKTAEQLAAEQAEREAEEKRKQEAETKRLEEVQKFKNYYSYIKRAGADKLLEWLEEKGFFNAPASTKYHGNYAGGLVEHSNHVFKRLLHLAEDEDRRQNKTTPEYTLDSIALVALLHDVCKIDAYKIETKNQKQKDGSWKQVESYTYTNAFPVGHGEKSVFQIMRFMQLSDEELMAIRWHMGPFDSAVKGGSYDMNNAFSESRLAAMLHLADMMATHLDEREDKGK
ncbi:MAG: hydrolase [Phascolarctobacterium sp.]|nr:hydrolase [Candidatus Phascolarctobacterium caballi]